MNDFYDKLDELYKSGDRAELEAFLVEAIASTGVNSSERAGLLFNLASMQLELGDKALADEMISEALEIYDAMPEPDVHHAAALTAKAVLLCAQGDHQGSLSGFRRALELTKVFFGENIEYARCKQCISEVCELLGDMPSSIAEMSDAVRILENLLGADHASVIEAQSRLEGLQKL